jgi:hypothetical protein
MPRGGRGSLIIGRSRFSQPNRVPLHRNSVENNPSGEANSSSSCQATTPIELQRSSPCTQESATCPNRETDHPVQYLLPYFFKPNLMHFPSITSFKAITSKIRNTFRNTLSFYNEMLLALSPNISCRTTPLRPSVTTYSEH